jgi:hypothetical protein
MARLGRFELPTSSSGGEESGVGCCVVDRLQWAPVAVRRIIRARSAASVQPRVQTASANFRPFTSSGHARLQTPQLPPSLAQCLQYLQFLHALHGSEPVHVAVEGSNAIW